MTIFTSPDELAGYLNANGVECSVLDDGFLALPDPETELTATIELISGWLIFKVFIADWNPRSETAAFASLLRIHHRLIGFRFCVSDGELWAMQDFPLEVLDDSFHSYFGHAFHTLGSILPALHTHLADDHSMSEDEVGAMFEKMDGSRVN